jgi:RNA polymerase sigma factor (sigma-70 family)
VGGPDGTGLSDSELYAKHADELTRFATGLVGPSDAGDVVADAVVRCFASPSWGGVRDHRAFLYRSVLNQARMRHRSTMRRRARELRASGHGRDVLDPPDVRPEVLEAVGRLSVRQRAVVVLTYWADLDPASVAALLGIGEGSVRRHLARARARLKEWLDE